MGAGPGDSRAWGLGPPPGGSLAGRPHLPPLAQLLSRGRACQGSECPGAAAHRARPDARSAPPPPARRNASGPAWRRPAGGVAAGGAGPGRPAAAHSPHREPPPPQPPPGPGLCRVVGECAAEPARPSGAQGAPGPSCFCAGGRRWRPGGRVRRTPTQPVHRPLPEGGRWRAPGGTGAGRGRASGVLGQARQSLCARTQNVQPERPTHGPWTAVSCARLAHRPAQVGGASGRAWAGGVDGSHLFAVTRGFLPCRLGPSPGSPSVAGRRGPVEVQGRVWSSPGRPQELLPAGPALSQEGQQALLGRGAAALCRCGRRLPRISRPRKPGSPEPGPGLARLLGLFIPLSRDRACVRAPAQWCFVSPSHSSEVEVC